MKTLFSLKSAINQSSAVAVVALVSLLSVIYPEIALGASLQTSGQDKSLVFEIKDPVAFTSNQNLQYSDSLTYAEALQGDPYVTKLTAYLEKHDSPLAPYADEIIKQPQWQRALAISWVESNFGKHCADNNCSGIGVAPGHPSWRKYGTKLDWFVDLNTLLEKPIYKEKFTTFKQMRGVYVYPGSDAWVNGAQQKYNELMALTAEAESEKIALAQANQFAIAEVPAELATISQ